LFSPLPAIGLMVLLLAYNYGYRALLRRWGAEPSEHRRALELLAHVQVLGDLVAATLAIHFSGGARSTFWPFLSLTVMAAALLFGRRLVIVAYATTATAMCWIVCARDGGGAVPLNALLLAALLAMVVLICTFYAERVSESRQ